MKTVLTACALSLLATACTRPPADPPSIEGQTHTWHYDRNPAQLPTTSAPTNPLLAEDPATMPVQLPDSQGTVRSPKWLDEAAALHAQR